MQAITFFRSYVRWHYTAGVSSLVENSSRIIAFVWRFFAAGTLLKTLFSPWRRMQESYQGSFNLEDAAGTLVVNVLMRGVGAFVRLIMIGFGLLSTLFAITLAVCGFAAWILLPAVFGIIFGVIVSRFV